MNSAELLKLETVCRWLSLWNDLGARMYSQRGDTRVRLCATVPFLLPAGNKTLCHGFKGLIEL